MISMNIRDINNLSWNEDIKYCLDFFKNNDMANFAPGDYETDKAYVSLRIDEYETQIAQDRYWQAHKNHIDVYILIHGQERIDVKNIEGLKMYHYDRSGDTMMIEETRPNNINLLTKYGDIVICYPKEAHKTGIHVELQNKFKVALFKIDINR